MRGDSTLALLRPITVILRRTLSHERSRILLKPIDGHRVIDIVGPQEISLDEWAHIAGQAIGKQIRVVTVPGDKLKAAMSRSGMSPEMAALLVEMEEAYPKIQGQFKGEEKRTGKVTNERLFAVAAWKDAPHSTDAERAALAPTEAVTRLS